MLKRKLFFTVQIAFFLFISFSFSNSAEALPCTDSDGDTYAIEGGGCGLIDCDDSDANVHPGAPEICDGKDSNCDGSQSFTDVDADGDGVFWCAGDCDDSDPDRFPGNAELCDGIDNDCSGLPGGDERDSDNDGVLICDAAPDCNDFDDNIFPGNAEICGDSKDNDCDNSVDEAACICPDEDGDGHQLEVCGGDDCDDRNPAVYPGAVEECNDGIDNDCDGIIDIDDDDAANCPVCTDIDGDGYSTEGGSCGLVDCNDSDPNVHPDKNEVCDGIDTNCDGVIPYTEVDADNDGVMWCAGDCADNDANRFPGNPEVCDGLDNDCNGVIPSIERDMDNDGFKLCDPVPDCNDAAASDHPGADEICGDGRDNNCNGEKDESGCVCPDQDGDGQSSSVCGGPDCDDSEPAIYLGAPEICTDGWDNDCDGMIDLADPDAVGCPVCNDADGDGFATNGSVCGPIDCNDSDPTVYPGASEICDGKDTNCDGFQSPTDVDSDADGIAWCAGDCDDSNPAVHPGATEKCDGLDNDCNGILRGDEHDSDNDGYRLCDAVPDCNDYDATVHPGAAEVCDDQIDNNCDQLVDGADSNCAPTCVDNDHDGYGETPDPSCPIPDIVDCDDNNPLANPGAAEICNGLDDNCNGFVDEGFDVDSDGDGFSICSGDCDDSDAAINPDAADICNGIDDNCNGSIDENSDLDGDGYKTCEGDCSDNNAAINPGEVEICDNGVDENCDGIDDPCLPSDIVVIEKARWQDDDGGRLEVHATSSDNGVPVLHVYYGGDSYQMTFDVADNRYELSVTGVLYYALVETASSLGGSDIRDVAGDGTECEDIDSDGYGIGAACLGPDCDDNDLSINPEADDICDNGIDENCNGEDDACISSDIVYITEAEWEDDDGGELEVKATSSQDKSAELTVHYDGSSYVMYYDNYDNRHELEIDGVPYYATVKVTSSLGSSASSGVDREGVCGSGNMITIKKAEWDSEDGGELEVTVKRYYDASIALTLLYGGNKYVMEYRGDNEYKLEIEPVPFFSSIQVTSSTGNFATANVELDD